VIHHYNPALPLVAAELVVRSGSDANPAALPGLAGFTAQMLTEGTATRSAPRIADEDRAAGRLPRRRQQHGASTVSLLSLRANFGAALDVLADVVLHPAFPTAEVERQRASRLGELMQQRDDPELMAALAAAGALYGPRHPYGYGQLGTEPAIRAVTRDDLLGSGAATTCRAMRRWWCRATSRAPNSRPWPKRISSGGRAPRCRRSCPAPRHDQAHAWCWSTSRARARPRCA
jgi:zinc protease